MHLKLIISHVLILIISTFGFTYLYEYIENGIFETIYPVFHLIVVFSLYVLSGYLATGKTKIFDFKNYYIVALIGFILWLLAVLNSPTDLDWKHGSGGILWLIYRMYISAIETPFNFSDSFMISTDNIKVEMGLLLILTIIPSFLQAFGGFLKVNRNKKNSTNN
jgi:hypothetical protein